MTKKEVLLLLPPAAVLGITLTLAVGAGVEQEKQSRKPLGSTSRKNKAGQGVEEIPCSKKLLVMCAHIAKSPWHVTWGLGLEFRVRATSLFRV